MQRELGADGKRCDICDEDLEHCIPNVARATIKLERLLGLGPTQDMAAHWTRQAVHLLMRHGHWQKQRQLSGCRC